MRVLDLLDLFAGAGGATRGYQLAGFHVTGVDIEPQPNYVGDEFIQADAMTYPLEGFDVIHASPPCQDHSPLAAEVGVHGTGWMLAGIVERLEASGLPYVVENVMGADLRPDLVLCGNSFGLRSYRHRKFRSNLLLAQPAHVPHVVRVNRRGENRREHWARGGFVTITGDIGTYVGPEAMGIDWMTGNELSQAIPPAYTEYVGRQIRACLECAA